MCFLTFLIMFSRVAIMMVFVPLTPMAVHALPPPGTVLFLLASPPPPALSCGQARHALLPPPPPPCPRGRPCLVALFLPFPRAFPGGTSEVDGIMRLLFQMFGPSCGHFGLSWGFLGPTPAHLWTILGLLWASWGHGHLGASVGFLGPRAASRGPLGPFRSILPYALPSRTATRRDEPVLAMLLKWAIAT